MAWQPCSASISPAFYYPVYCKTMLFDSAAAQQLKQTAIDKSANSSISTFQAVIACAWKRVCRAWQLPAHQEVHLRIPGNARHLIMPSMTAAYFGNAVMYACTSTTAGELQRESVGAIAAKINTSMKMLRDQEFLRQEIGAIKKRMADSIAKLCDGLIYMVMQGSKLPVFEVDVGVGRLEAIRPAVSTEAHGLAVFPGREEGSISVFVQFSD